MAIFILEISCSLITFIEEIGHFLLTLAYHGRADKDASDNEIYGVIPYIALKFYMKRHIHKPLICIVLNGSV